MRVLHIMATAEISGGANHLLLLLPALAELGWECRAAVGTDGPLGERLVERGVATDTIELMASRTDLGAPKRIAALIARHAPDIVHFHGTRAAFFGALARRTGRAPRLYTVHGLSYRKENHWPRRGVFLTAELWACRRADHVISVSAVDLEDLRRRHFVVPERSSHIPNAVDLGRFHPGDREAARARLGLPSGSFVVGTVSRLVVGKGVRDLVLAAAASRVAGLVLVVVGDGPERPALTQLAADKGVTALYLGMRDDVPQILQALDLFALPSHWEGEPLALLEAIAVGLPCVATCTPGARDLLARTQAGSIVPIGDAAALGRAIQRWAQMPTADRQRFGASARPVVDGRSPTAAARAVAGVYESLLRGRTHA